MSNPIPTPRVEVALHHDPAGTESMTVFIDGVPTPATVYSVDPNIDWTDYSTALGPDMTRGCLAELGHLYQAAVKGTRP